MKKPSLLVVIFSLLGAFVVLFLLAPLLKMLTSVRTGGLAEALADSEVRNAIALTLGCALWATLIGALLGVPLAYLLARRAFFGRRFIAALVDLPVVIPHPVAGIALLLVFGRQFYGGRFFSHLGLTFVGDIPGIVAAMIFVSISLLINAARDGFLRVDPRLENVARTLGYSPLRTFFFVSVPLSRRSLLSGAIMMWARAISEFGSIVVITYNPKVASVLIYDRFTTYGLTYALPVALILVLICLLVFALLRGINLWESPAKAL
ncbi:MAG: ABC transporter permease [Acidobacteria bacterium]|nr:ABC transporter permease [Acidobacteriota bacterium]MBI3656968.1 ABC transporter permease [Acidobacteriota bacterium]